MMLKTVPLLLGLFLLVLSDPDPEPAVYDDPEEEKVKCNNNTLGGSVSRLATNLRPRMSHGRQWFNLKKLAYAAELF